MEVSQNIDIYLQQELHFKSAHKSPTQIEKQLINKCIGITHTYFINVWVQIPKTEAQL